MNNFPHDKNATVHPGITRREMLKRSISGAAASYTIPAFLGQTFLGLDAFGGTNGSTGPIVVVLQLSGGNDSLNTIVPHNGGDSAIYYADRPNLAIPPELTLPLNGVSDYALHPKLTYLQSLWDQNELAIVNGVGYPNSNLSHFVSTDYWHTAEPNLPVRDGWLGRFFDHQCSGQGSECDLLGVDVGKSGLAFESGVPDGRLKMPAPDHFRWKDNGTPRSEPAMEKLYSKVNRFSHPWRTKYSEDKEALAYVQRTTHNALISADTVKVANDNATNSGTFPSVVFPSTSLGAKFSKVSSLIAGGLSSSIYYVDQGGYDTHSGQYDLDGNNHPTLGRHADLLEELNDALGAFVDEMKNQGNWDRVLLFTFSEFGRKVIENGSQGTDHGAAASLFVTGGGVNAGMYRSMPSLAAQNRIKNESLDYNVDFRRVYRTVLENWLNVPGAQIPDILPSAPAGDFSPLGFV